jgi:hypothetical protein
MDVVLSRTTLETACGSVCLLGEAAMKDKSLAIKNVVSFHSVVENSN